ncbi:MAG: serine/threonine protein kinase [Candidatus Riflebacteria bacterium]|nr:serine/threonine protein kinase [Candidatus Riflebacteria bacterium]
MTTFPLRCASKFKPQRLLARGGYGSVWLAIQEGLEREVALKLLLPDVLDNPEAIARFKHEARVTASLNHPGIVVVIDHDVEEGVPWIAYEYLPGGSLRRRLDLGTIPWREVVQIGIQMCAALEEMHGRGILHRDI